MRILLYAEDPGAVNFIAPVAAALHRRGDVVRVVADGTAAVQLPERGIPLWMEDRQAVMQAVSARSFDAVVVGTSENSRSFALDLIALARESRVPSIGVVDGPASTAYRFRGTGSSATAYAPDRVLVPDEPTRQDYIREGFVADHVAVVGHPLWDQVRAARQPLGDEERRRVRRSLFPQVGEGRPLILFLADLSTGLDPQAFRSGPEYTLHGRGHSLLRGDIVLEEVLDAVAGLTPRPDVAVRLHPKASPADIARYQEDLCGVSQGGAAWPVVQVADLVIGMSTILLVEAALLGVPTLSVLPREAEKAWLPSIAAGVTPVACTRQALTALLPQSLGRAVETEKVDAAFPPGAVDRVLAQLEGVAG